MQARSCISLALGLVYLNGCSSDPRPSTSQIEQAVIAHLPAFARLSSFSVEAMQNMGTKVEPLWHARFHGSVRVASPTFVADGTDAGVTFVRAVKQAGESIEVFGKSASTLYAGAWRTSVEFEGQPIQALGLLESAFGSGKMIVRGSKDEAAYLAEQAEKQRLAIIAAQREAEQLERQNQERQKRVLAALGTLETSDCAGNEETLPSQSERIFVVNPLRACWTPWLAVKGSFSIRESGNILMQEMYGDGTIGEVFEDGPNKNLNTMRSIQKVRLKSLGREPVTVTLRLR